MRSTSRRRSATSFSACFSFAAIPICPSNHASLWRGARCAASARAKSRGLLTTEGNVQKRIVRAKDILRTRHAGLEPLTNDMIVSRLAAVHAVLYLMFNEGYNSTAAESLIRRDVCSEAMR